jgi:hypothetical protein
MKQAMTNWAERIITPSGKHLSPVKETTIYPGQAADFLREQLQGQSVAEAAEGLGLKASDLVRLLNGSWKPSKEICRRMGLRMVYAIADGQPRAAE